MEIIFEYHNARSNGYVSSMATKKLKRLIRKYPFIIKSYVFFKEELSLKEKGRGYICGIRLSSPGPLLYASSHNSDLLSALNETIKSLKTQLNKRKSLLHNG
ncbi:HPF/RaiA family ribosome-associated protein [Aquimarina litoralis]|uniref:HPF/RaiA family ribosome-associated protein n=1 Tax=Aquimarina litoralis TaxID=584605 RepID=UPI001C55DE7A|nr:HPF/RaiA family ribosome-associated protein [Aquimarina litoralis]MBW1295384.1 30S ribosomal protein S30 [Aquimarina litoralis]